MGLGKFFGKVTETVSDLTLGVLHSRPVQGVLKGTFKGIANSVNTGKFVTALAATISILFINSAYMFPAASIQLIYSLPSCSIKTQNLSCSVIYSYESRKSLLILSDSFIVYPYLRDLVLNPLGRHRFNYCYLEQTN